MSQGNPLATSFKGNCKNNGDFLQANRYISETGHIVTVEDQ